MTTTGISEDVAQVSPIESGDSNDRSGDRETEVVLTTQAAQYQSAYSTLAGRVKINFQFHKSPLSAIDASSQPLEIDIDVDSTARDLLSSIHARCRNRSILRDLPHWMLLYLADVASARRIASS